MLTGTSKAYAQPSVEAVVADAQITLTTVTGVGAGADGWSDLVMEELGGRILAGGYVLPAADQLHRVHRRQDHGSAEERLRAIPGCLAFEFGSDGRVQRLVSPDRR